MRKKISLRDEHAARTKDRIAEAVAALVGAHGAAGLSMAAVAKAAGIGVATIYRYYSSPEELLAAYGTWVQQRLGLRTYDVALADLPAQCHAAFRSFDTIADHVRAQVHLPSMRTSFKHVRRERLTAMTRSLEPVLIGLDDVERRMVLGVFALLTGAPAWQTLRDEWGLDGDQAGRAAAWGMSVLIDHLRRHPAELVPPTTERPTRRKTP